MKQQMANSARFTQTIFTIILKGHWNHLLEPKICSQITSTTINHLLLHLSVFSCNAFLSWSFFQWVKTSIATYNHSLQSTWTMVHILTKHKHFKTAHHLLDKIPNKDFLSSNSVLKVLVSTHSDVEVNSHVLSWLVISYGKLKMTQDAYKFLSQ